MFKTLFTYTVRIDNSDCKPTLSGRKYKASKSLDALQKHAKPGATLVLMDYKQLPCGFNQEVFWDTKHQDRYVVTEIKREVVRVHVISV